MARYKVKPIVEMEELQDLKSIFLERRHYDPLQKEKKNLFIAAREGMRDEVEKLSKGKGIMDTTDESGFTVLHHVARYNNAGMMEIMLDSGADINAKGPQGFTALHLTARYNCIESARILIERNADQTVQSDDGAIPLHEAARRGYTEIAKLLLDDNKECVNTASNGRVTPFGLACMHGHHVLCELLIKFGADIRHVDVEDKAPLHLAAIEGHVKVIQLLIETASTNSMPLKEFIDATDYENSTALHLACFGGREMAVHELLKRGADANARRLCMKITPLHIAVKNDKVVKILEDLLAYGAKIESCDSEYRTPMHRAAIANNVPAIKFLLDNNAKIDPMDNSNYTPFLSAVRYGRTEAAAELLNLGANMKAVNMCFMSCLHLAVKNQGPETLEMLLKRDDGTMLNSTELDLQTPLHYAAALGNIKIISLLLEEKDCLIVAKDVNERTPLHIASINGAVKATEVLARLPPTCVNARDCYGESALHAAAAKGYRKTCAVLLEQSASTTIRNLDRRTPLHAAVTSGSVKTVKCLLESREAHVLELQDINGDTALHLACANDDVQIVKLLLDEGADVTVRNNQDETCLDMAIDWELANVSTALVQHERWWEVMCTENSDGSWPMERLIERLPNVASLVLDQCIEYSYLPTSHSEYYVKFSFQLLDLGPEVKQPFFGPENMVRKDREDLLNHPVTQALLRYKWFAFGKLINYLNFLVFIIYTILFTYFIVTERGKVILYSQSNPNASIEEEMLLKQRQTSSTSDMAIAISVFACIQLLKEIYQMAILKLEYLTDVANYLELALYISTLVFICPYLAYKPLYGTPYQQWNAGVVALSLCCLDLLLYLRHVGSSGIYVSMYFEVWITFMKAITVFMVVIFGSAMVIYVLLKEEDNFSSVWFAFAKTSVMMVGELDYTDMLSSNVVNNNKNSKTNAPYVPLPAITYISFYIFMMMVPVLLMNLLVGLAVGDIAAIQKAASVSRLKDQVRFVADVQNRYPHRLLNLFYKDKLTIYPNRMRLLKSFVFAGTAFMDISYLDEIANLKTSNPQGASKGDEEINRQEKQTQKIRDLEAKVDQQTQLLRAIATKLGMDDVNSE